MKLVTLILVVALLGVSAVAVVSASDNQTEPPSLADRINQACKKGYHMTDWLASDYADYLPKGVVMVTCSTLKTDRYGVPRDKYQVAVEQ